MLGADQTTFIPVGGALVAFVSTANATPATLFSDGTPVIRRLYNNDMSSWANVKVKFLSGDVLTVNIAPGTWHDADVSIVYYTGTTLPSGGVIAYR